MNNVIICFSGIILSVIGVLILSLKNIFINEYLLLNFLGWGNFIGGIILLIIGIWFSYLLEKGSDEK